MGEAGTDVGSASQTDAYRRLRGRATEGGAAKPGMVRRGPTQEGIHVATDKEWRGSCRAYDAIGLPRLRRTMAGAKTGHESGVPV